MKQTTLFILIFLLASSIISAQNNYAFAFAGSRACFNVNDNEALDVTTDFTIEAWVYPTSTSTFYLAERESTFRFYIVNSSGAIVRFDSGPSTSSISSEVLELEKWHHIAVVCSSSTATVYTNGVAGSSATITLAAGEVGVNIGAASSWSSGSVTHQFDELKLSKTPIYSEDFTPSPNAALGSDENTVFYFQFEDNSEVPPLDDGPLSLTVTNGPTSGSAVAMTDANYVTPATGLAIPVELSAFNVDILGNEVVLNWRTASETNNFGFEIERAVSNESNFEKIGFIEGNVNSNSIKSYSFSDKNTIAGTNFYRLKQIDLDGSFNYSDVVSVEIEVVQKYALNQNYPNPFNPSTVIEFSIPETQNVSLKVFNSIGQEVAELAKGLFEAGSHSVNFDASNLQSGVYFYRIESTNFNAVRKMMFIK